MRVSNVFDFYKTKINSTPNNKSLMSFEPLENLEQVKYLLMNDEKVIDEWLVKKISEDKNCDCWNEWFPTANFGFTQSSLTFEEQLHFEAIESIFRSVFLFDFEKWTLLKNLNYLCKSEGVTEIGPFCRKSIFIVKSESNEKNVGTLIDEYIIGKTIYNQMRKRLIPNFPYYFGAFRCQNTTHIIMENVHSCVSLTKFAKATRTTSDIEHIKHIKHLKNILFQIVNALVFCFVEFKTIFDNLNPDDIIIKQTNTNIEIPVASLSKNYTSQFKTLGNIAILTCPMVSRSAISPFESFNQLIKRLNHRGISESEAGINDYQTYHTYQKQLLDHDDIQTIRNQQTGQTRHPQPKDVINLLNEWLTPKTPETSDIPLAHDVQMIICLSKCCNDKYNSKLAERFIHVYNRVIKEEGPKSLFIPELQSAYYQRFSKMIS